jgi:hypothetical protein
MAADAKQLYAETVRLLSADERLKLATLILQDLVGSDNKIEFSDAWTEQDLHDLTSFALSHSESPHETQKKEP